MSNNKPQYIRTDKHKPSVAKFFGLWWARVWDLDNKFHSNLAFSQPEALTKAYELAELVATQRHGSEPTA